MAMDAYARSELGVEDWDQRLRRVSGEMRDIIAATVGVIAHSRECLTAADRSLQYGIDGERGSTRLIYQIVG